MPLPDSDAIPVTVHVHSQYVPNRSIPERNMWYFIYHVTIRNEGAEVVQLVRRHWIITNAEGQTHEVRGEGVIGTQPFLVPHISFRYTSACPLDTPFGTMRGHYTFLTRNDEEFEVPIPEFSLAMPYAIN